MDTSHGSHRVRRARASRAASLVRRRRNAKRNRWVAGSADGSTSSITSWSSQKVTNYVAAQVAGVLGGASAAYDTLQELQAFLQADDTAIAGILTSLGLRLRFDAAQVLTTAQQLQGCTNIGVGDPETNFVTVFNTGLV